MRGRRGTEKPVPYILYINYRKKTLKTNHVGMKTFIDCAAYYSLDPSKFADDQILWPNTVIPLNFHMRI